ncbi:hypothetical protein V5J35_003493 [Endozoicomonas sp. NE40]|uniref:DUF3301 domain-containing protein n=2 Tax=Endozoicomonas lisbonensis TaxID=3120522 RepID=A0ABV2SKL6_9GAMM
MLLMDTVIWIIPAALAFWYWSDTSKAREVAITHGKRACRDMNLQFLDGTVVRYKTRPRRGPDGQMCLARDFSFEFTPDGIRRYPGHIRLLGSRLQMMDIQSPDQSTEHDTNVILSASYRKEKNVESGNVIQFPDQKH